MAQTTILAAGQTAATSSDIVLAQNETRTVGIFVASGKVSDSYDFPIMVDTPGADYQVDALNGQRPTVVLAGPGTFRVKRPDISAKSLDVGIFTEG